MTIEKSEWDPFEISWYVSFLSSLIVEKGRSDIK